MNIQCYKYILSKARTLYNIFIVETKLDDNEINFIYRQAKIDKKKSDSGILLVQVPTDYYYLCRFDLFINESDVKFKEIIGLSPYNLLPTPKNEKRIYGIIINTITKLSFSVLFKRKWVSLYRSIGVSMYTQLDAVPFSVKVKCWYRSRQLIKTIKTKHDLLTFNEDGLLLGDLIYDTYLRFRSEPTVDLKDPFLRKLILKSLIYKIRMEYLFSNVKIDTYITSYTSYIHHGIAVRVALENEVKVYSDGNLSQYIKELSSNNFLHVSNYHDYKTKFYRMKNKKKKIQEAEIKLKKRFLGKIDNLSLYMKKTAYSTQDTFRFSKKVEGVLFLHDFFDNPHCYREMVFSDFLEWTIFTLNLIRKLKLSIAVKPHPNQLVESAQVISMLQDRYPEIYWIEPSVSNNDIFNNDIKYGISCHGTVLYELAYHGIKSIAAGDNPTISFDFVKVAKNRDQYVDFIINSNKISLPMNYRDEVLSFYYMHSIYNDDALDNIARGMDLKCIDFSKSNSLNCYLNQRKSLVLKSN